MHDRTPDRPADRLRDGAHHRAPDQVHDRGGDRGHHQGEDPWDGPAEVPRWAVGAAWAGLVGVTLYVVGWALAGAVRPGYDAREQAISELFELGSPWSSRWMLVAGLVVSGVAMVVLAPALHRTLPGRSWVGPSLVTLAGLGTLAIVAAPCSPGCPGAGASPTDTAHGVAAGVGYVSLILAPLAVGWRVRRAAPRLAAWSFALGGLAVAGFVVRYLGVLEVAPGWQQRAFNTVADLWYVIVAVWILRRA
jgi:hypothetical protein